MPAEQPRGPVAALVRFFLENKLVVFLLVGLLAGTVGQVVAMPATEVAASQVQLADPAVARYSPQTGRIQLGPSAGIGPHRRR